MTAIVVIGAAAGAFGALAGYFLGYAAAARDVLGGGE